MARTTKLTPEVIDAVCLHILDGNYKEVAAPAAGLSVWTFRKWLTLGRKFPDGIYGQLVQAVQDAEAQAEITQAKRLYAAAVSEWQAAVAWLERKFPKRWGRDRGEIYHLKRRLKELEALTQSLADQLQERTEAV